MLTASCQKGKCDDLRAVLRKVKVHHDKNWYPSLEGIVS